MARAAALILVIILVSSIQAQPFGSIKGVEIDAPSAPFAQLIKNLFAGYSIRFSADYNNCNPAPANAVGGDVIETFEYFNSPVFGPQSYFAYSNAKLISNYQGTGFVYDFVKYTVWDNSTVTVYASDITADGYSPVYEETFACQIYSEGSGSVHYHIGTVPPKPLTTFDDIINTLNAGIRVRYVVYYKECLLDGQTVTFDARGGDEITTYEYFNDAAVGPQPFFSFARAKLIKNYQKSGTPFVYDLVEGKVLSNGTVFFHAADLNVKVFTPVYSELFTCQIFDGSKGAVHFFALK